MPQERTQLPVEVCGRIVFFVSLTSPPASSSRPLYNLCLVSTTFRSYAEPLLYHTLYLNSDRCQQQFWRTVCHRPALWFYVRNVFLGERDWKKDNKQWSGARPTPRLGALGAAIAQSGASTDTPSSSRWAEQFQLMHPHILAPIGVGPQGGLLEEVAWWEQGGVGGIPSGHCYSTAEEGSWCHQAEKVQGEKQRARARTMEDVDLGRGPGQAMYVPSSYRLHQERDRPAHSHGRSSTSQRHVSPRRGGSASTGDFVNLDEDDVWAAAERLADSTSSSSAQKERTRQPPPYSSNTPLSPPANQNAQEALDPLAWQIPSQLMSRHSKRRRLPWRYRLITGTLDPALPKLFEAMPTLVEIHMMLYLGTHLDHDLLEHQLRLLLDPERMPNLLRLDISVGHDATNSANSSRLARLAFAKIVKLAVDRVDDERCRLVEASMLTAARSPTVATNSVPSSHAGRGSFASFAKTDLADEVLASTDASANGGAIEVKSAVSQLWQDDVCFRRQDQRVLLERSSSSPFSRKPVSEVGQPYMNGWLARDQHGTNDPIEE